MLFNSIEFLIFFPLVTGMYFLLPHAYRWFWLLAASCFFYMTFIPVYILILLITILIDYFAAIYIVETSGAKKKFFLVLSIISTCAVLFVFKYFNFFNDNVAGLARFLHWNYPIESLKIILPIGLSFHTFQSLSYVIEVYKGRQKVERNFGIYSLYVMFYPQLVAGPIERPQNLLHQFYEKHKFRSEDVTFGLKLMLWGMFKKIVVADRLAIYVNAVYDNPTKHDGLTLFLATIFFGIQIYCDFSGYSDIAIGSARVMGFKLMTNFNRPYFSKSIHEFWSRWHISLSTWFKDYLYIPMGGNRVTKILWYRNLFVVFIVSGIWHGANWTYIIWGALHGFYLVFGLVTLEIRKKFAGLFLSENSKILKLVKIVVTFLLVSFAWIFFRARSFTDAQVIISKIFTHPGKLFVDGETKIHLFYAILAIAMLLAVEVKREFCHGKITLFESKNIYVRFSVYAGLIIVMLLMGVFDAGQFIYFQF